MRTRYAFVLCALTGSLLAAGDAQAQRSAPAVSLHHGRTGTPHPHAPALRGGGAPANDECASAEALVLHTPEECTTMATSGDNGAATTSSGDPSCDFSGEGYQDVWYAFNSGENEQVLVTLLPDEAMTDWAFTVSEGCDGTEVACFVVPDVPMNVVVTPNTDYVVRVYSNLDWGVGGPFTLCVAAYGMLPEPPVNDACGSVTPEALSVGGSLTFTGTVAGATVDGDYEPGSDLDGSNPSAWHAFTTTECADITVGYCGTPTVFGNVWIFLSTTCPAGAVDILAAYDFTTCADGNVTMLYTSVPAGTYYLPVMLDMTSGASGPYTINVSAAACPAPPPNDDCIGAIPLTSGDACVGAEGTVAGATQSMDPLLCNGYTSPNAIDVWYSFVATSTDETIGVQGQGSFDAVVELFMGTCGSLTSIGCADATVTDPAGAIEEIVQTGLTVGSTYYVRVYCYANMTTDRDLTICVKEGAGSGIGISEHTAAIDFSVYPNPTEGDLTLTYGAESGTVTIDLLDMAGRTVFTQQRFLARGQSVTLDLPARLSRGAYTLRLGSAAGRSGQRVLVK